MRKNLVHPAQRGSASGGEQGGPGGTSSGCSLSVLGFVGRNAVVDKMPGAGMTGTGPRKTSFSLTGQIARHSRARTISDAPVDRPLRRGGGSGQQKMPRAFPQICDMAAITVYRTP